MESEGWGVKMEDLPVTESVNSSCGAFVPLRENSQYGDLGVVYLEVKLHHNCSVAVEEICDSIYEIFYRESGLDYSAFSEDLHLTLWEEILDLEAYKGFLKWAKDAQVLSLKAVEYVPRKGQEFSGTSIPVRRVIFHINVYQLRSSLGVLKEEGTLLQGEVIHLPSVRFEGIWESLFFNKNIRENLVRLIANMPSRRARMNRLMLLSGPPGTGTPLEFFPINSRLKLGPLLEPLTTRIGKTTLSQALAQKLSIRLNKMYPETQLILINAATLLSKFFSESAKHIIQIFTAIEGMCQLKPDHLICVLIDEIESLASSRGTASSRGEVQDGIRATNALLTGFDRVKSLPNLIILCTSNMADTLDAAFLDRCGHHILVEPPSIAARYHILRESVQDLIASGIISGNQFVPSYRDAQLTLLTEPNRPGSMLIRICQQLDTSTLNSTLTINHVSARYLGQLPEVALADGLVEDSCDLNEALERMTWFVGKQNAA